MAEEKIFVTGIIPGSSSWDSYSFKAPFYLYYGLIDHLSGNGGFVMRVTAYHKKRLFRKPKKIGREDIFHYRDSAVFLYRDLVKGKLFVDVIENPEDRKVRTELKQRFPELEEIVEIINGVNVVDNMGGFNKE